MNKNRDQFNKFFFERNAKDVENNIFQAYDWDNLKLNEYCGFFMWHVPDSFFMDTRYIENLNKN